MSSSSRPARPGERDARAGRDPGRAYLYAEPHASAGAPLQRPNSSASQRSAHSRSASQSSAAGGAAAAPPEPAPRKHHQHSEGAWVHVLCGCPACVVMHAAACNDAADHLAHTCRQVTFTSACKCCPSLALRRALAPDRPPAALAAEAAVAALSRIQISGSAPPSTATSEGVSDDISGAAACHAAHLQHLSVSCCCLVALLVENCAWLCVPVCFYQAWRGV